MNKKTILTFIIVVLILIVGFFLVVTFWNKDENNTSNEGKSTENPVNNESEGYEDYLEHIEGKDGKGDDVTIIEGSGKGSSDEEDSKEDPEEEPSGDNLDESGIEENITEINENGTTLAVSTGKNTSIVVDNKSGSNKVTFSDVEEENNSSVGIPALVDIGKGVDSSNGIDTSNMKGNKYSEAVKDIYKDKVKLNVIPVEGGFGVFNDKMKNVYSSKDKIFFYSSLPEYDDLTVEVLLALDFDLTEKQIRDAIDKTRKTGDFVSVGKYEFKHGGDTSAIRW